MIYMYVYDEILCHTVIKKITQVCSYRWREQVYIMTNGGVAQQVCNYSYEANC